MTLKYKNTNSGAKNSDQNLQRPQRDNATASNAPQTLISIYSQLKCLLPWLPSFLSLPTCLLTGPQLQSRLLTQGHTYAHLISPSRSAVSVIFLLISARSFLKITISRRFTQAIHLTFTTSLSASVFHIFLPSSNQSMIAYSLITRLSSWTRSSMRTGSLL